MCFLCCVLRCQVFVAGGLPLCLMLRLNTNNDMQMSLHLLVVLHSLHSEEWPQPKCLA